MRTRTIYKQGDIIIENKEKIIQQRKLDLLKDNWVNNIVKKQCCKNSYANIYEQHGGKITFFICNKCGTTHIKKLEEQ